MAKNKHKSFIGRLLRTIFLWIPLALVTFSILWVTVLKWCPVTWTPLMGHRKTEYRKDNNFKTQKKWISIENISPELKKAVIASEDNLFVTHHGFDWDQLQKAIDDHTQKGKKLRGASTISQQTAKNVFLPVSKSFARKAFEAYFTVLIEWIWGKERILEVYLNVAEMGKGIYGAEAAARHYFGKPASQLTRREACLIAACLPNPLQRNPARPSKYVSSRATAISRNIGNLAYPSWISRGE